MTEISRAALFGKLNNLAYKGIESATVFCKMRGNPYVELVHWLHQILQLPDSDVHRIIKRFELNPSRLANDFVQLLDRLPAGASSLSDFSTDVEESVEKSWLYASLKYASNQVRSGHLVVGIIKTPALRNKLLMISQEFKKINTDTLVDELNAIVQGSPEDQMAASDGSQLAGNASPGEYSSAMPAAQMGKQKALQQFSMDLTEAARQGKIDPIVGRDNEIRQLIDILMRRRQNNPILTGEAGVGKTAVVEGFALKIASGDVPPPLQGVSIRTLDLGLLQAGASMKGEFENRLRQVIDEVQASEKPIILFIDEAHTLIGAGGSAGTGDAANLLKPALARGTLRTIAATTWSEYKKYFEKDPALTRRFQVVKIDEPHEEKAIQMVRCLANVMEQHHKVLLLDEALEDAVKLSHRYIPDRQLPDKCVSVLDTACARVAISQSAVPPEVEDSRRKIDTLKTEAGIIEREHAVGVDIKDRKQIVETKLTEEAQRLEQLEQRWLKEKQLVDQILELRIELHNQQPEADLQSGNETPNHHSNPQALATLKLLQQQLVELQGEQPLMFPTVDSQAVASVIAGWTGIPVGRMVKNEIDAILNLGGTLNRRVIGQRHALDMIARRVQTSRANLDNPGKPIGVFLLCGSSGVGKTETGLALAEALYGGEENIITINMSEYQEAHAVSTLKGSPPGYVGYGEGGILTEAVRRRPYSVILLDEVEKAHPDVHEIFFQVFDKGWMEDAEGRFIDFKNTIILLTSNAGTDLIMNLCKDPELMPDADEIAKALRTPLLKIFPAALLGRLVTIPYYPISDEMLRAIIKLQLNRIEKRIKANHRIPFGYDDAVVQLIADRCNELESGARVVDAILTNTVLPAISQQFLTKMMTGEAISAVNIGVQNGEFSYRFE
ncbi:type VI secretion system protein VasG [Nitrosomonas sp. Nm84]|uniref:type VI secretion system ATPase TssH n=1 Tax=Nitrosomonas sp. Nm84 TaxID=200124 RepID=UPI000D76285C|nr:type VI secretion system ATPase TssH [Nitrosomonas sp. Nm84]PXW82674.1 type VI secretion system protein VasG [Nitrosomonas sp. Nm84]